MTTRSYRPYVAMQKVGWAIVSGGPALLTEAEADDLGAFHEPALTFEATEQTVGTRMCAPAEAGDNNGSSD